MITNSPLTALVTEPLKSGYNTALHGGDTRWSVVSTKVETEFTVM